MIVKNMNNEIVLETELKLHGEGVVWSGWYTKPDRLKIVNNKAIINNNIVSESLYKELLSIYGEGEHILT